MKHSSFEWFAFACVLLNVAIMATEHYKQPEWLQRFQGALVRVYLRAYVFVLVCVLACVALVLLSLCACVRAYHKKLCMTLNNMF